MLNKTICSVPVYKESSRSLHHTSDAIIDSPKSKVPVFEELNLQP